MRQQFHEPDFEAIWQRFQDFSFVVPSESVPACRFAEKFAEWANALLGRTEQDASVVSVNQAKVLLLDKYFEWRSVVPRQHRLHRGERGHVCIYHVFTRVYERLREVELALTPPMLFIPEPPPPTQIAVIFNGRCR